MITLNDIRIMNDTLVNYYKDFKPEDEKKLLKHRIIQEILKIDNCFNKISKEEAIKLLSDIGITESEIEATYNDLVNNF
jgi:hypothetical protein